MKRTISIILIAAGIIVIGIAAFMEISTRYNQKKLLDEYQAYNEYMDEYVQTMKNIEQSEIEAEASGVGDETLGENSETTTDTNTETNTNTEVKVPEKPKAPDLSKILEGKNISGMLEIPAIKVNSAILEGTDDSALKYAVGHYPGLGQVGMPGNYVLLGHRNYVYGHFFKNLDKLEVGDEVIITKGTETYTYIIYESFVVSPEEVWVLDQTEDTIVTMITCTPIGTYTDRLIVRGALQNDGV